jgi:hypothetical protein
MDYTLAIFVSEHSFLTFTSRVDSPCLSSHIVTSKVDVRLIISFCLPGSYNYISMHDYAFNSTSMNGSNVKQIAW